MFEPVMMTVSGEVIKGHLLNLSLARGFGS